MNDRPMIEAEGLRKVYGEKVAVDRVDLEVPAGRILGVLGPNGAGKSTTVRMLTTMTAPDAGTGRVAGFDVAREAAAVRRVIGVTGQDASLDELLTGTQNLVLVGELSSLSREAGAGARRRAARALRAHRRRRAHGEDVLGRHAAPARPRRQPGGAPAGAVPRRADHRPRPDQPTAHVGDHPRPRGRRHHRAAHHAVPRRGRRARRPHLGDRPRHRDRRGHRPRAQGAHRW